ncbi:MAG TPA: hypothetical protein VF109_09775 [Mycobacteriales bacterium]
MTARRILGAIALLLAAATTAACAQQIAGTGTLAADAQTGGSGTASPSSSPSASPADTESPSATASSSGGSDTSPVCDALDRKSVETAFGTSVSFARSQSSGCQIRADDGRSMIVAVFNYLTLAEYKKPGNTDLTIGGHPATRTPSTIIYVARSTNPSDAGLIAAYFSGLGDNGDSIAVKVLELVVKKFAK